METLINLLNANNSVSAWKINKENKESCELFYVGKNLETNRATLTEETKVTVYVDKDNKRGNSSFSVDASMDENDIAKAIEEAVFGASLALNEFFELPKPTGEKVKDVPSNMSEKPFVDEIEGVVEAIFKNDNYKDGQLSATEIFLDKITNRIINSNGIDETYTKYEGFIEAIPTWKKEDGSEFETYNAIRFADIDLDDLQDKIKDALETTKDRAVCVPLAKGTKVNVLFQAEEIKEIMGLFVNDLSYASEYQHMSLFKIGEKVQGEDVTGDLVDITLVPSVKGSASSCPIDNDGVVLHEVKIIDNGVAVARHGDFRTGYYLGVKEPTGKIPNIVLKEGKKTIEELKKEPYVECARMSAMQADIFSGFFGGEVRLGYYFDGEKVVPVTSFSANGNFHKTKGTFEFSKETTVISGYKGPKYLLVKGVEIL